MGNSALVAKTSGGTKPSEDIYSTNNGLHVSGVAIPIFWTGSGTGGAPSATNLRSGTLGADSDGIATGIIYHVVNGSWVSTTATVANLYGV